MYFFLFFFSKVTFCDIMFVRNVSSSNSIGHKSYADAELRVSLSLFSKVFQRLRKKKNG